MPWTRTIFGRSRCLVARRTFQNTNHLMSFKLVNDVRCVFGALAVCFDRNAYYSVPTLFQLEVDVVKPSAVQPTGEGSLLWLIAGFSYLKSLSLRNVYGWTNHSNSQAKNWRLGIQIIATCSPKRRRNMVDTSIPVHLDPGHEPRVLVEPSGPARTTDNCDHVGLVRTPVGDSLFVNMHGRNLVVLFQLFVANTPYSAWPILRETTCKDVTLTWYRQSGITVYSFHTLFHTLSGFSPRSSPGLSPIFFPQWYLRTLYSIIPSYFETDYDGAKILIIAIYLLAFVAQVIKDLVYSGILENKTYSKMTTTDNKKKLLTRKPSFCFAVSFAVTRFGWRRVALWASFFIDIFCSICPFSYFSVGLLLRKGWFGIASIDEASMKLRWKWLRKATKPWFEAEFSSIHRLTSAATTTSSGNALASILRSQVACVWGRRLRARRTQR